jgi:PRC-barrel domain
VRSQTFFESTAAARGAPRTSAMAHFSDLSPEARTSGASPEAGRATEAGRTEMGHTPEVRTPMEGSHSASSEPERRSTMETGRTTATETGRTEPPETGRTAAAPPIRPPTEETARIRAVETTRIADRRPPIDTTAERKRRGNGSSSWAYWALPLAALAGLGWYFLGGDRAGRQVADAPPAVTTGADSVAGPLSLTVGGVDIGRQLTSTFGSLGALLDGIKDRATATTALPKLQETTKEIDRLAELSGRLPEGGRIALANATAGSLAKVNTALDKAAAMPEVAPLLLPTIDQLRGKMNVIAMVPAPGRPHFVAKAPADWVLISTFLNRDVHNSAGERIGTVNEFLLAPDGRVAASIVGVGRDLGFGEKLVAVPFGSGQMQRKDNGWRMVIDATKESLQTAPAFERKPPR